VFVVFVDHVICTQCNTWASKGTPGDAQCVTEILRGDQNKKEVRGEFTVLFQGKINALNRLDSQINVFMFMSKKF